MDIKRISPKQTWRELESQYPGAYPSCPQHDDGGGDEELLQTTE